VASAVAIGASQYFVTPFPDLTVKPLIGDRSGGGGAGLQLEYRFR
jgi:hypothetical protein